MHSMLFRITVTSLALLSGLDMAGHPRAAQPQGGRQRIVAVGDVHGSLSGLTQILEAAGIIDARHQWSGGTSRLVQTGDFLDRGPDVRKVMDLLMRLESDARRGGGRVDVLLGNHEGMNLLHDFRDVSPQAYAAFADGRSADRQRRAFEARAAIAKREGQVLDPDAWMAAHPPGFVEYVEAIGPGGRYGRWIRSRKVVLQIDDSIFMHAGLSPDSTTSLDEVNRGVEREIRSWDGVVATLERQRRITRTFRLAEIVNAAQVEIGRIVAAQKSAAPLDEHVTTDFVARLAHLSGVDSWALIAADGPLWYRGLATLPADAAPAIDTLLGRHGARRFVVGHSTQLPGRVNTRFDGRVVLGDTGMLSNVYKGGRPSAVEIQDGRLTAIYPSSREPLPPDRQSQPSTPR